MTSTIKVNTIQNTCGADIIKESGNTITIGASGDTVTLGSGASQTGFGREGSVNWQTGSLKTSTFTAVSGEGYFINQGSAITMNLPAGSAGAIVAVSDYARNFATYNLTITPNGSEKIGGSAASAKLNVNGQAATFVYVDSTKGWVNVQNAEDTEVGTAFIAATGGTTTTSGDFKIHTFTGPGTFCVSAVGNPAGSTSVDYMVVAGGGAGAGKNHGGGVGGGGAGGIRIGTVCQPSPLSPAPLVAPGHTVSVQGYPIVVGGGGSCSTNSNPGTAGVSGSNSSFSSFTAAGGGGGNDADDNGAAGGSGGGGGESDGLGGSGNSPPVSPAQGKDGGDGLNGSVGGGGGGFTAEGGTSPASSPVPVPSGKGGAGIDAGPIFGTANGSPGGNFGGGGSASTGAPGCGPYPGASGGGGNGNAHDQASTSGGTNTGGGGGAHGSTGAPQGGTNAGGSGIVIIRYKFQ